MPSRSIFLVWQAVFPADAVEDAGRRYAAGHSFRNGAAQGGQLFFVFALLAFKKAKSGSHHFAGIGIEPAANFGRDELVHLRSQIDVAGGHTHLRMIIGFCWQTLPMRRMYDIRRGTSPTVLR